ncbi:MAG: hypothetical protein AAF740_14690 [Bacteroidota bacterium]
MKLEIRTKVNGSPEAVMAGFTRDLFEALSPPFPPVKVKTFDGSKTGDHVDLELNFIFFKERWLSVIIEDGEKNGGVYFVDEGRELPFFLSGWRHEHRIEPDPDKADSSIIVDSINFKTPIWLPEFLMLPALWGQFLYRIPIYKRFFA